MRLAIIRRVIRSMRCEEVRNGSLKLLSATSARGVALRSSLAALTKPSPFREFSEAGISEAE